MDEMKSIPGGQAFRNMCAAIGKALAEARLELELTPEEVARIARVSPLTVRRVEEGELGPFTLGSIERIADAVGVPLFWDATPAVDELVVLAAATDKPVRVCVRVPGEGA